MPTRNPSPIERRIEPLVLARYALLGELELASTFAVGSLPSGIEAGDFDEDGVPDLAISNQLSNTIGLILSDP